ncbi:hypothetical protein BGW80DRAFT_1272690 [Lactifluus volemus]|nr:hypothetical protein BGW80DRAFT_1272690 [Lactifluus volemus]
MSIRMCLSLAPSSSSPCTLLSVFNPPTYPNFLRFLKLHSSIEIIKTQMTFSVSRDGGAFEWAGDGLRSVFCQPKRVFDLGMWRMLFDIMRFNACAVRVLSEKDDLSIGEYLRREGYSSRTPPDVCSIDFPAKTLIRFLYNHHLLQITGKPSWLTIKGGSKKYVNSILAKLPAEQLHLSTPVQAVSSTGGGLILETTAGARHKFDHVIFACHSDDALRILEAGSAATPEEREALSAFRWNRNEVWLHSDESLMPRSRLAWSCWNYLTRTSVNEQGVKRVNDPQVSLTYWMNDLQRLSADKHGHLFATLNPLSPPSSSRVLGRYSYSHPVLSSDAVRAQRALAQLNASAAESGRNRAFAGAWARYGFHEDGFTTGLRVAASLPGVALPFSIADADVERGEPSAGTMAHMFDVLEGVRAFIAFLVGKALIVLAAALGSTKKVD